MDLQQTFDTFLIERNSASQNLARSAFKSYHEWFEGSVCEKLTLDNWTTTDINDWISHLRTIKHLAPATINAYKTSLSSFCDWCIEKKLMSRTPFTKRVTIVRKQDSEVRALERNEENALLRAIESEKVQPIHRFIILFLLHTGLRSSELANLELRHISLGEKGVSGDDLLAIRKPESVRSGSIEVIDGKGGKDRTVPLNATAREALVIYLATRPQTNDPHLLISPKFRTPLTTEGITYTCEKFRTTISDLHPHMLRSTFATRLCDAGKPIEVVSRLLGHSDTRVTYQRYVANRQGRLQAAVEAIG